MEAVFALAGVFVGWLLALATEVWRSRREARDALTLIAGELRSNANSLDAQLRPEASIHREMELQDQAWRTYGGVALRLADRPLVEQVITAYEGVRLGNLYLQAGDAARKSLRALIGVKEVDLPEDAEEHVMSFVRKHLTNLNSVLRNTVSALLPLTNMTTMDLVVVRLGRWRQRRRAVRSGPPLAP